MDLDASYAAREQLLTELAGIVAGVDLNRWAHRGLRIKSTLTSADAQLVEDAFQIKLAAFRPGLKMDVMRSASPLSLKMRLIGSPTIPLPGSPPQSQLAGLTRAYLTYLCRVGCATSLTFSSSPNNPV